MTPPEIVGLSPRPAIAPKLALPASPAAPTGVKPAVPSPAYNVSLSPNGQIASADRLSLDDIERTPPSRSEINSKFEQVAQIYSRSVASGDKDLALRARLLAVKFVYQMEKDGLGKESRETAKTLGIYVPITANKASKAIKGLWNSPSTTTQKLWANTFGGSDLNFSTVTVQTRAEEKIGPGRAHAVIASDDGTNFKRIGDMTKFPAGGTRVNYTVYSRPVSQDAALMKGDLAFSSASYITFIDGKGTDRRATPAALSIRDGKADNLRISPTMHGIIMITNGQPQIINQKNMSTEDRLNFVRKALETGGTLFQSNLLVFNGKNIVPENGSSKEVDVRRVLATFADGSFAIISFTESLNIYDLGHVLEKLGVQAAVNLDTGSWNVGGAGGNSYGSTAGHSGYTFLTVTPSSAGVVTAR